MSGKTSTILDHCTPAQLKALLTLAAGPGEERTQPPWQGLTPEDLTRLLSDLLTSQAGSGGLLLATVLSSETPVEALSGVKDLAKKFVEAPKSKAHHAAATILYHVTVAAAFAWHGKNISSRPIHTRCALYEDLATAFPEHPLSRVFRKAVERALASPGEIP